MKVKVSDYIVNFLEKNKLNTLFTITGGFAMHLNDSFGRNTNFDIYYQHHEQACGYSALGYTKTNNIPSIVCTTAGVAATNAISPCLVAYQDSVPILFISGQVKSTESIRKLNNKKMKLRHYAGADSDIIDIITPITKYAHEITNQYEVKSVLEKALFELINGRPGPVWLSIPVDIQGMLIDKEDIPIIKSEYQLREYNKIHFDELYSLLMSAERPIIIAGNGIKLSNTVKKFKKFILNYNIPVVTTILATDLLESDDKYFIGKVGLIGDRAGNFSIQNSDLVISLGCRMAQGIVGYREEWFAREAKIVYLDNDINELAKNNLSYTLKINIDLNNFFDNYSYQTKNYSEWINKCNYWKKKWLYEVPSISSISPIINPYIFLKHFFYVAPNNKIILASSGSIVTNVWHMLHVKKGDKFLHSSQGDMGFELPASIGASIAEKEKLVITILGEGSFQLNIQELQTIVQYKLPIKILIFNNASYGAIEITQTNFFNTKFGVNKDSGISFPDTEKIANAYNIKYISVRDSKDIETSIQSFLALERETVICEVFCCIQGRYPRLSAIKNDDGTFTNRPFEDMEPFMNRDEFKKEMIVKIV
jgi:acetolactate synthase-1/2/3 large subunit